jgi:uncharacterized protein YcbK (DUF882 family)
MTRRSFVKHSLLLAAGLSLPGPLQSHAAPAPRPLSFYHTHTGERLVIPYSPGGCKPAALQKLNNFLRDFRTGDVHAIDPQLLDILHSIRRETGCRGVIEIISGFRSPRTNKTLRTKSGGVARKSLHMKGKAVDIRIRDLATSELRDAAVSLRRGGVGYYAKSDFVHIDTGRFRTW